MKAQNSEFKRSYHPSYDRWVNYTYYNAMYNFKTTEHSEKLKRGMLMDFSSIKRSFLCKDIITPKTDIVTFVFRLQNAANPKKLNSSAIYCILYRDMSESEKKPLYTSVGPSLISNDGEYRKRLFAYSNYVSLLNDTKYPAYSEICKFAYEFTKTKIHKTNSKIISESFTFHAKKYYSITEDTGVHMLSITWLLHMYEDYIKITDGHINEKYKMHMGYFVEGDKAIFADLVKRYSLDVLAKIYEILFIFGRSTARNKVGHKIIPINQIELSNPFDIRHKVWREYFVSKRLHKLVINNVAIGFPFILGILFIKGISRGLFDNESQYDRIKKSDLIKDVVNLLQNAEKTTKAILDQSEYEHQKDLIKSTLVNKFKLLEQKIQIPVLYSVSEIMMTDVAISVLSEYLGNTFYDSIALSKQNKLYRENIGNIYSKSGFKYFEKYMFELCYNMYCMHKVGIIHGDLHLNNITLFKKKTAAPSTGKLCVELDLHELYILGEDSKYQYMFPTTLHNVALIDFSRCVIHNGKVEDFADSRLPPKLFPITNNLDEFRREQTARLAYMYTSIMHCTTERKDIVTGMLERKYDATFKLLTAIDLYNFANRASKLFKIHKLNPQIVNLTEKMQSLTEIYLISGIDQLLHNAEYEKHVLQHEFPVFDIIHKLFPHYLVNRATKGTVADIFISHNPESYSIGGYDSLPDHMRFYRRFKEIYSSDQVGVKYTESKFKHIEVYNKKEMAHWKFEKYDKQTESYLQVCNNFVAYAKEHSII